jgi:hypothetical protein
VGLGFTQDPSRTVVEGRGVGGRQLKYLDHSDFVGQEPKAHHHTALSNVQPLLCHTCGHQKVQ